MKQFTFLVNIYNFRLIAGQWNSVSQRASFPGFFQASLDVDGPPRGTFIRLPVSEADKLIRL